MDEPYSIATTFKDNESYVSIFINGVEFSLNVQMFVFIFTMSPITLLFFKREHIKKI